MKMLITIVLTSFMLNSTPNSGTLKVEVSNFKSYDGTAYLTIYTNEDEFLKAPVRTEKVVLNEDQPIVFEVADLSYGAYAFSITHDENDNGELDTGLFGIPQEGYAFSNNAQGSFGPPSFEKSKFNFSEDTSVQITLIHPPF